MGMPRYARSRDQNEPEIVQALRKNGAVVYLLDTPLDLLVGYQGVWRLVEVKMPGAKTTPAQDEVFAELDTAGMLNVTTIVRYPAEALSFIGIENRGVSIGDRVRAMTASSPWLTGESAE